ncbi:MAG: hypothetical protein KDA97_02760 [Acidimicrobiales bacterium]|nr:hypothetical protein [Acidimicrobiales bacterium]
MARSLRHRIAPRYPTATTPISWEVPKQGRRGPKPKLQWAEAAIIELSAFGAAVVAPQEWAVPVGGRVQVRWGGLVGTVIVRRAAHYSRSSGLMLYGVEFAENPSDLSRALYEHLIVPQIGIHAADQGSASQRSGA